MKKKYIRLTVSLHSNEFLLREGLRIENLKYKQLLLINYKSV